MFNTTTRIFLLVISILFSGAVYSAEITSDGKTTIKLSGEIKKGDYEQLLLAFMRMNVTRTLRINSNGGDLEVALHIAEFIKDNHIGVVAEKAGYCASSCFFIFIAGFDRLAAPAGDDGKIRSQSEKRLGYIGIHRPYYGGTATSKKQEAMMNNVKIILAYNRIPNYLIDIMMGRPSNDIYWLSERDLDMIGENNPGDEEVLIKKCGYRRFSILLDSGLSKDQMAEEMDRVSTCSTQYWIDNYYPIQVQTRARANARLDEAIRKLKK